MRGGDLFSPGGALLFGEGAASRPRGGVKGGGNPSGCARRPRCPQKPAAVGLPPCPGSVPVLTAGVTRAAFGTRQGKRWLWMCRGGCWSRPRAREIPAGLKSGPKTVPVSLRMGFGGFGGPRWCRWGWRRRSPAEWGGGKVGDLKCLCSAEEKSSLLEGGCLVGWILVPDPRCCVRVRARIAGEISGESWEGTPKPPSHPATVLREPQRRQEAGVEGGEQGAAH